MTKDKQIILIVEDEKSYRTIFSKRLIEEGYDVLEAENGEEGLKVALEKKPDLILLDLEMPVMDGIDMLGKLREDAWGKDAEVVILTNISDNEKLAEAIKHHTFVYLVKTDMTIDELVAKVKQTIEDGRK